MKDGVNVQRSCEPTFAEVVLRFFIIAVLFLVGAVISACESFLY